MPAFVDGIHSRGQLLEPGTADDDAVDLLGDQVLDVGVELGGIAIGIGADDLDIAYRRGLVDDGLVHADEVGTALGEVRHADRESSRPAERSRRVQPPSERMRPGGWQSAPRW